MKKFTLLLVGAILLSSCGRNKEEQMLYDYQQNNVKALNLDLADLNFKIQKVEKITDITASDSLKHVKKEFALYWSSDADQTEIDTLSFDHVKNTINKLIDHSNKLKDIYEGAVLTAIRNDDYSGKYDYQRKADGAIEDVAKWKGHLGKVESFEGRYNELAKNPDVVLSTKYSAKYSFNNPMLSNAKQTFDKIYYTNNEQTKFIIEETDETE